MGFAILTSVEDRLGFLPAPGVSLDRLQTLSGADRSRYVVASSYHTAFVMGLLCAGALRDGCRPPWAAPIRTCDRGAAVTLIELMGPTEPKADWKGHLQMLAPQDQDSAAPLLLNICLRRAAVRRDFGVIRSALLIGEKHGLLDTPSPRQAAQLMRRAALYAATKPATSATPAVDGS